MNAYLIESLAPLAFRAGKPFGSQASQEDATFPLPSTGAGLIRYLALKQQKVADSYKDSDYQKLLKVQCYGVYLARFDDDKQPIILLPKPANCLCIENDEGKMQLIRLAPKDFDENCGSDLPSALLYMRTVNEKGEVIEVKGKPKNTIKFWQLQDVIDWQKGIDLDYDTIANNGLTNISVDIRTHNALDDETLAVVEGDLFQTASFDLNYRKNDIGFDDKRLGFVILSNQDLDNDLATFGGERRLSYFKSLKEYSFLPQSQILDNINQQGGFCITLMTPAIFAQGYLPKWIEQKTMIGTLPSGASVKLVAAAVERYQAVSGWDSVKWQPKATRKAVSAGAMYWFELQDSKLDEQDLVFLHSPLSDDEFDKADGFGMAIVSSWQNR